MLGAGNKNESACAIADGPIRSAERNAGDELRDDRGTIVRLDLLADIAAITTTT